MTTHQLWFPGRPQLMNQNRKSHWREAQASTKALRTEAALRYCKLEALEVARVTSWPIYRTKVWPDVGAWAPTLKAVIDGLVDAAVLPGDGPHVVQWVIYAPPQLGDADGLCVELTDALTSPLPLAPAGATWYHQ